MNDKIKVSRLIPLSLQHVFAMFGATILVPIITGLDPSVALFTSGVGTLLFHIITGGQVPAYLGSSFAFLAPILAATDKFGISAALGGCVVAGLIYVAMGAVVKMVGPEFIHKVVPPVVIGPVIMTIGLGLAPVAKNWALTHYPTAFFTLAVVILVSIFAKGIFKVIPIFVGMISGYIFALILQLTGYAQGLIDFSPITEAHGIFALPNFTTPTFNLSAILIVAPVAVVTLIEHLGDVLVLSRTVDKDFIKNPGLHRTLWGDGIATALAGFLGGPPNTTYGENVGVLALTKVYNPIIVRVAAMFVVVLSLVPKFGALLKTIPFSVLGGVTILVYGMIAAVGMRTLIEKRVNLASTRNLIIVSTTLVLGISGIAVIGLEGMGLGAIVGVLLNLILPEDKGEPAEYDEQLALRQRAEN